MKMMKIKSLTHPWKRLICSACFSYKRSIVKFIDLPQWINVYTIRCSLVEMVQASGEITAPYNRFSRRKSTATAETMAGGEVQGIVQARKQMS